MPCFKRNWFRADLREMARSCSNLQQVDRLHKYAESSTIKVFYRGSLWVHVYQYVVFACGDISHVSAENVTDIFSLRQAIDGQKKFSDSFRGRKTFAERAVACGTRGRHFRPYAYYGD